MQPFLHTLLTMSLTASLAALGVMLLRPLLKKAPTALVCALWLVVFARMLCPLSFSLPVSLMPETVVSGAAAQRVLPAVSGEQASAGDIRRIQTGQSLPTAESIPARTLPPAAPVQTPPVEQPDPYPLLFGLWAAGGLGLLLWSGLSYGRLRYRVREAVLVTDNIYESDRADSPFVCGFFRPRVYLPPGLSEADRRYVILHEQAHIARGDHILKPIAWLALCLHWFNPVLWLAFRLYGRDVERACDQRVIRSFDRKDTAGYAEALLHLGQSRRLTLAAPLAFGEENAMGRIRHVLAYRRPARVIILCGALAGLAAAVLLLANPLHQVRLVSNGHLFFPDTADPAMVMPKELQKELTELLNSHRWLPADRPLEEVQAESASCASLSTVQGGLSTYEVMQARDRCWLNYYRMQGEMVTRSSFYALDQSFDRDYTAWLNKAEAYLWESRPDALYDLGPIKAEYPNDLSPILDACNLWPIFPDAYDVSLDPEAGVLSFRLHQIPPLRSQQTALADYLRDVSLVLQTLVPAIDPVRWSLDVTEGDWTLPETCPGTIADKEAFRQVYRDMEAAARLLRSPIALHEYKSLLYLSPALQDETDSLPLISLDLRMDRFDCSLYRPDGSDPMNISLSRPVYDCHRLREGEFPAEAGIDLDRYQEAYCTIVKYWRGRESAYRLYELDRDLFLAKYNLDDQLDYMLQLQ